MDIPFAPMAHVLDEAGTVTADLPCRKCGYNLRGLGADGRCPECGAAVGLSVQGSYLRFADPAWVRTLSRAVTLIIAGLACIVLALVATIPLSFSRDYRELVGPVIVVGLLLMYVLWLVGAVLLTTPDPSGIGEDQYGTARKIIRVSLAVGVANALLLLVPVAINPSPELRMLLEVINLVASVVAIVGTVAQLQYLQKLALRIPDLALSVRAGFLKVALPLTYGVIVGLGFVAQLLMGPPMVAPGLIQTVGCFVVIAAIVLLVFSVMFMRMLERMGKRFSEQAKIAEQTWASLNPAAPAPAPETQAS